MANLYQIIDELRQERPGPQTAATLDLLTRELGRTQESLKQALANLADRALPTGGRSLLDEVYRRAYQAQVEDLSVPVPRSEAIARSEGVDRSQVGIALLLGGTAALVVVLAVVAFGSGLNQILHFI